MATDYSGATPCTAPSQHIVHTSATSTLASHAAVVGLHIKYSSPTRACAPDPGHRHGSGVVSRRLSTGAFRPVHVVEAVNGARGVLMHECLVSSEPGGTCVAACTRAAVTLVRTVLVDASSATSDGDKAPPAAVVARRRGRVLPTRALFAAGLSTIVGDGVVVSKAGIEARGGSWLLLRGGAVMSPTTSGVRVHADASAWLDAVAVTGAGMAGVEVGSRACVGMAGVAINGCKGGVLVSRWV